MASRPTKSASLGKEMDPRSKPQTRVSDRDSSVRVRTVGTVCDKPQAQARPRAGARDKDSCALRKPEPLIPEHNMYVYKPSPMTAAIHTILGPRACATVLPETRYSTHKLVRTLCTAAENNTWNDKCEKALVDHLPVREHHKAFLSHNMYVTMIGTLVARALEQATYHTDNPLDLLADRYYVRQIASHDSSKTSKMEASAYSGIIAWTARRDTGATVPVGPRLNCSTLTTY